MSTYVDDVEIKASTTHGSGLFAKKAIPSAGNLIFSLQRPLVGVIDTKKLEHVCSNCFEWTKVFSSTFETIKLPPTLSNCGGCKVLRYCSKKCQSHSWKRWHKHECGMLKALKPEMRVGVVRMITQLVSMDHLGTINEQVWQAIKAMAANSQNYDSIHRENEILVNALAMLNPEFSSGLEKSLKAAALTLKDILCRISTNSLTLVNQSFDDQGATFDPLTAAANHSCDPNAVVVMDGAETSFRSMRPIAAGEEIFISYVDNTMPYSIRQWDLKQQYFFTCVCSKCATGSGPGVRENLFYRLDQMSQEFKDYADSALRDIAAGKVPDVQEKYCVNQQDELDSRRAAVIQQVAFKRLEDAKKDKKDQTKHVSTGLRDVGASDIFPITRQPAASLWHESLYLDIQDGTWIKAWITAVKEHCEIDPVLYPWNAHPLRVVHTWILIRLSMHLFSDSDPIFRAFVTRCMMDYDIDLAPVLFNLLTDLKEKVKKSHGPTSSLARGIGKEWVEVAAEMSKKVGQEGLELWRQQWPVLYERFKKVGTLLEI